MKTLILALILTSSAYAWNCDPSKPSSYEKCLKEVEATLSGKIECDPSTKAAPQNKCEKKYSEMYADGTLNITMAGGYFEVDGTRSDSISGEFWNNKIKEKMIQPCPMKFQLNDFSKYKGESKEILAAKNDRAAGCGGTRTYKQTCGFKRTDDPEVFLKQIYVNGKSKIVKVRVLVASLSPSDKKNRKSRDLFMSDRICDKEIGPKKNLCIQKKSELPDDRLAKYCKKADIYRYQICKSQYVKNEWQESIMNGDEIVMYNGHARDGGGPSFEPPKVRADGHVDYGWYQKHRPGHKAETEAFKAAVKKGKAPSIYGSLSCSSKLHFMKRGSFPSVSKNTSYILSKRTAFSDELTGTVFGTIEGVLSRQCGEEYDETVKGAGCAFQLHNF